MSNAKNYDDTFNVNVRGSISSFQSLLPLLGIRLGLYSRLHRCSIALAARGSIGDQAAVISLGKTLAVE